MTTTPHPPGGAFSPVGEEGASCRVAVPDLGMRQAVAGFLPRRAGPADAAAVRALTRAAYAGWVPILGREPMPMVADYDAAVRLHRIDLLERDGVLWALIELVERDDDVLIENIAVDPARQGAGLGDALLGHAAKVATARGTPVLRLYTNARMAANIAFYGRRGFAVEREEERAAGWRIVHMVKRLGAAA